MLQRLALALLLVTPVLAQTPTPTPRATRAAVTTTTTTTLPDANGVWKYLRHGALAVSEAHAEEIPAGESSTTTTTTTTTAEDTTTTGPVDTSTTTTPSTIESTTTTEPGDAATTTTSTPSTTTTTTPARVEVPAVDILKARVVVLEQQVFAERANAGQCLAQLGVLQQQLSGVEGQARSATLQSLSAEVATKLGVDPSAYTLDLDAGALVRR